MSTHSPSIIYVVQPGGQETWALPYYTGSKEITPRPYWSRGDLLLDHRSDVPHDAFRLTAHWIPRQPATTSQSQPQALKQNDLSHKLCDTNIQSTRSWCEVKLITVRLLSAYLPVCVPIYLSAACLNLPTYLSVCLPICTPG